MNVLVIGASENPERYANKAIKKLLENNHTVFAIASRPGESQGIEFLTGFPELKDIHTVTLYINKEIQKNYYDYILQLKPKRVIFNPGTENESFYNLLKNNNIQPVEACTLVMLSIGNF
ncbi:MAG: CoA-binding protein [Vicingaceae bacterium]